MRDMISKLFRQDDNYFSHVEGLRSLSAFRVMLTHIVLFGAFFYPQAQYLEFLKQPLLKLIHMPSVLLDSFFVISGLVIAYSLIKLYKKEGEINLFDFYVRRFARIIPLYILTIIISIPLYFGNIENLWANILFINNHLTLPSQYAAWTWAIAVEVQFYLLFGAIMWLVSKKIIGRQICYLIALFFFLLPFIIIPLVIEQHHYYYLKPLSFVLSHSDSWTYFDLGFDKFYIRCSAILYGVLSAYIFVYHREKLHALLQRFSSLQINLITLTLVAILIFIFTNDPIRYLAQSTPTWQTNAYWALLIQHQLFGLVLSSVLLLADAPKGILMLGLVKLLNSFVLRFLGRLSYTTYMIHPVVFLIGYPLFFMTHSTVSANHYVLHGFWLILITYLLAIPCYLFVECPAMENIKKRWLLRTSDKKGVSVELTPS